MDTQHDQPNRRWWLIALGGAIIVAIVVGAVILADDDEPLATSGTTTSSTELTTTSVETTTTEATTTSSNPAVDPSIPVWPRVASPQRFTDPVSAARSFVTDFVGMVDPVIGDFQQGDTRSGEVPVRPRANGPVTTVLVRQLDDGSWFVLGAATDNIRLDEPSAMATISCPVRLTGEALAFEGVVGVAIRDDLSDEPLGSGTVLGGGGPAAPFDGTVACDLSGLQGTQYGSVVLTAEGGADGRVWQATVVRVQLQ